MRILIFLFVAINLQAQCVTFTATPAPVCFLMAQSAVGVDTQTGVLSGVDSTDMGPIYPSFKYGGPYDLKSITITLKDDLARKLPLSIYRSSDLINPVLTSIDSSQLADTSASHTFTFEVSDVLYFQALTYVLVMPSEVSYILNGGFSGNNSVLSNTTVGSYGVKDWEGSIDAHISSPQDISVLVDTFNCTINYMGNITNVCPEAIRLLGSCP